MDGNASTKLESEEYSELKSETQASKKRWVLMLGRKQK